MQPTKTRNDTALPANAHPYPSVVTSSTLIGGATARPMLYETESMANAGLMSSAGTRRRTVTFLAGNENVKASPLAMAPHPSHQVLIGPANASAAISAANAAAVSCAAISVGRPPNLLVITPAHGPRMSGLENCAQVTRPTTTTEWDKR